MQDEEIKLAKRCNRCGKPLKNKKSQKLGYGRACFAKSNLNN